MKFPEADVTVGDAVVTADVVDTTGPLVVVAVFVETVDTDIFLFSSLICSWCYERSNGYDWLGPRVISSLTLISLPKLFFQHFGERFFFCLCLFFKMDSFWCKILQNIGVEQHLGVQKKKSLLNY